MIAIDLFLAAIMPGPTTEVLSDDVKGLRSDIHKLDVALARLSGEFGVFKWLLGATLGITLGGIVSSIWWAATINTKVGALEGHLDRMEAAIIKAIGWTDQGASPEKR